jgi:hypothetical protein
MRRSISVCPLIDQRADVVAGRLAPVPEGDRAPDLAQGSPARPGGLGERHRSMVASS